MPSCDVCCVGSDCCDQSTFVVYFVQVMTVVACGKFHGQTVPFLWYTLCKL